MFGFAMNFRSGLSKLQIGKSPCAVSHPHYTGKTLAKSQIKLFANILWSQTHFTIKRAAETPLPQCASNERQLHQSYAPSPDPPQEFNFCFPKLKDHYREQESKTLQSPDRRRRRRRAAQYPLVTQIFAPEVPT